ncbi:FAD-dependent monooxygenase [Streptomyces sp. NPDC045431]|uniref:FAD-dependent oxidoreductase n=1 Tax=Streptomyces sp. NPDC045431 TaxID=3155613 RepID=UPI0033E609BB
MTDQLETAHGVRHAVVIGGSLAGLLAARVLAEHAERVTVIERDRFPEGPQPRAGVPQGRHIHVLLESGQRALDTLLPGVVDELRAQGAPRVGMPDDLVQWQGGRWYRRTPATAYLLTGSRPHLEHVVRRRVLADPRIRAVEGTEAVGLIGDAARVRGVLLRERGAGAGAETSTGAGAGAGKDGNTGAREGAGRDARSLAADLVVDASGRGSRAAAWLSALGAEPPHEETLDTGLAYATRLYRAGSAGDGTDGLGQYIVPHPQQTRGAVVLPLEDGRHLVTLSGLRGDEPPTDGEEFVAYAARLPHPLVSEWLAKAEPDGPVHGFRRTANVRRRYDRPGRRPAGFLATGDALCTFNPIYGQGMSVAALSAVALRDALADPRRTPTTRRVQRALFDASRQAWDVSAGADRNMPGAQGDAARARAADRAVAWYLRRVQARAVGDPEVGAAFRSVLSLVEPPTALFAPRIARAVLLGPVREAPTEPQMWRESTGG